MEYLNRETIERVSHESFQSQQPYPWVDIQGILTPEGHELLRRTVPDVSLFDRKVGVKRGFGQGYHDRCILHYHAVSISRSRGGTSSRSVTARLTSL